MYVIAWNLVSLRLHVVTKFIQSVWCRAIASQLFFQQSLYIFDWIQIWALSMPLHKMRNLIIKPIFHYICRMLGIPVFLESDVRQEVHEIWQIDLRNIKIILFFSLSHRFHTSHIIHLPSTCFIVSFTWSVFLTFHKVGASNTPTVWLKSVYFGLI